MSPSKQTIYQGWALTLTMLFMFAFPILAAAQSDSVHDISDEKLEAVARAYIEVYQINQSYKSRIEAAKTTEEADQLKAAANQAMKEVIDNEEAVTVTEYNDVIQAVGDDGELRERLQAQVDAIQEEESNKKK